MSRTNICALRPYWQNESGNVPSVPEFPVPEFPLIRRKPALLRQGRSLAQLVPPSLQKIRGSACRTSRSFAEDGRNCRCGVGCGQCDIRTLLTHSAWDQHVSVTAQ